jgi:hypothetical protein
MTMILGVFKRIGSLLSMLALCLVLAAGALATPAEEKALLKAANAQIDVLLNPSSTKPDRIAALRKLKKVGDKMKALAAKDPNFKNRSDTEDFRNMHDQMGGFLKDEAKRLGVDLAAADPKPGPKPKAGPTCEGVPLPDYSVHPDRLKKAAKDIADAYEKLMKILKEPRGESFKAIDEQRNRRDRALEDLIKAQAKLAWEVAGKPDPRKWVELLRARDKFTKHLNKKRSADAEETKLMQRLADLHAQFNKSKQQFAQGGKTPPNLLQLDAEARRVIREIMKLRGKSNKAYKDYLAVAAPMEKAARKIFNEQLKAGVRQINFKLKQQGYKGPPFTLFRPKTGNERRLVDKILAAWLIRELGLLGARENLENWIDFKQFKDFDFNTGKAADCDPKKKPPKTSSNVHNKGVSRGPASKPKAKPKTKKVCRRTGGLVGAMNCVTIRIEQGG